MFTRQQDQEKYCHSISLIKTITSPIPISTFFGVDKFRFVKSDSKFLQQIETQILLQEPIYEQVIFSRPEFNCSHNEEYQIFTISPIDHQMK